MKPNGAVLWMRSGMSRISAANPAVGQEAALDAGAHRTVGNSAPIHLRAPGSANRVQSGIPPKRKQKGKWAYVTCEPESCGCNNANVSPADGSAPSCETTVKETNPSESPIIPSAGRDPSINDVWAQYYAQYRESPTNVIDVRITRESKEGYAAGNRALV